MRGMASWKDKLVAARNRAKSIREATERKVTMGLQAVEVGGVSYLNGYAREKYPKTFRTIGGKDLDLVAGLGLVVLSLTEVAGDVSEHTLALGAGLLGCSMYRMGREAGAKK